MFAICCAAFGITSLARINPEDNYLESMVKLLPVFGAATAIQAVILHASLLRAIWQGQYPVEAMSPCQRLACNFYCSVYGLKHWRHIVGFHISALCAFSADHSLWKALRYAREIGQRGRPSRAESAAEKGRVSTAESAAEDSQGNTSTPLRATTFCTLAYSFTGFVDLGIALYSGNIDTALSFFGPCFLAALIIAALPLHGALSRPNMTCSPNSQNLVFAYRCGGCIIFPWICLALGFAMWYYKGRPLYPGVYAAGYWASALYMGVGEVLEQSLLSP